MIRNFLIAKITRAHLDPFIASHASNAYTLDIGCEDSPYAAHFPNRVGFDIQPGRGVDVVGDAHALPFPDETFDQVLCTEVLAHLHTPQVAIDEMRRVLKPGGTLILTTRFIFPLNGTPIDYFRFTKYGLQHLLREWKVLSIEEESTTMETFAVLLQRIGYHTDVRGGTLTKSLFFLLARCVGWLQFLVKKEYGVRSRKATREERAIMTSGYYCIAQKI